MKHYLEILLQFLDVITTNFKIVESHLEQADKKVHNAIVRLRNIEHKRDLRALVNGDNCLEFLFSFTGSLGVRCRPRPYLLVDDFLYSLNLSALH